MVCVLLTTQNWLPWQRPLRNRKNWTRLRKFTDRRTDRRTLTSLHKREMYITSRANKCWDTFAFINCITTSSEAILPILPKILFAAR